MREQAAGVWRERESTESERRKQESTAGASVHSSTQIVYSETSSSSAQFDRSSQQVCCVLSVWSCSAADMELSSIGDQVFAVESITKKRVRKVKDATALHFKLILSC